jgi:hypothetical protein
MKTPQTKQKQSGQGSLFNWRWIAMLALLACLMAGRATAGTLTATSIPIIPANKVYLGAEGDLDWAHWGTFATGNFNHKAGVISQISDLTLTGGSLNSFGGAAANCVWFDGSMDKVVQGRASGAYVNGPPNNGFVLTIPAAATAKILNLYIGRFNVNGQLDLALSDGTTLSLTNTGNNRFTITFADSTASATLTVNYYNLAAGGNVTLMAASLATATSLPLSVGAPQLSSPSSVKVGSTFDLLANPLGVAANGTTAFAYQWQVDGVDIVGATNNPFNGATAGSVGVHNYRLVITNSVLGSSVTSAPVALTVSAPIGTIAVSGANLPPAGPPTFTPLDVNLTTEGVIDWGHWGQIAPTDYDYKNGTIGNFTQIGSDLPAPFTASASFSWTDATTANNPITATTSGLSLPVANGFALSIPASSTSNRIAYIYVGVGSGASLHVEAAMSDNSAPIFTEDNAITSGTRRYTIMYQAASAGATLNLKITEPQRTTGNGSISLQSASLQPVPPLSVSALVADPGTAVLVNQPMIISLAPFQPQGSPPFSYVWQRDPTGTGTSYANLPDTGTFASFVAGSTVGSESCRVIITGSQGSITSAPVVLTRTAVTGLLKILSKDLITGIKNLTTEGSIDWSHWGNGGIPGFDQKLTGASAIGNYVIFGPGTISGPFGSSSYSWTDGTPNLVLTNSQGIYHNNNGNGFELDVAAATTNRVLHVYLGSFQCVAHVEAYLSDNSALKVIDETIPNGQARQVNVEFAAGSPGQTLIFRYWDVSSGGGNVTLMAASLEGVPPLAVGTPTIGPASTVAVGSSIYLDAQGANGLPPLKYQWQLDSGSGFVAMPGATNAHIATSASAIGSPHYRVVVTDLTGSTNSAPVALTVTAATSSLVASSSFVDVAGPAIDLTAEGVLDWRHWYTGGNDQKDPIAGQISDYTIIGTGPVNNYYGNGVPVSWTDGTPTLTGGDNSGLYINGPGNGFEVSAEATAYERVFNLYCAVYQSTLHVEATMSDGSAPIYIDESFSSGNAAARRYSFQYSSPTPGKQLIVRWWDLAGANITINAATLTYGSILKAQPIGGGQMQVTWPIGTLLEAPTVTGPWTTNNATSPYTVPTTGSQKYFRVIIQ